MEYIPKNKPYKIPYKTQLKREIRRLVVEGKHSYTDIMQQLGLSRTGFYRYLNQAFEDDRKLLAENIDDTEVLNQQAILKERWLQARNELWDLAKKEATDDKVKIDCFHLIGNLDYLIYRLHEDSPLALLERHKLPRTRLSGAVVDTRLILTNATTRLANNNVLLKPAELIALPSRQQQEEQEEEEEEAEYAIDSDDNE